MAQHNIQTTVLKKGKKRQKKSKLRKIITRLSEKIT